MSPSVNLHGKKYYMYFNYAANYGRKEGCVQLGVSDDGVVFTLLQSPEYEPVAPHARWFQVSPPSSFEARVRVGVRVKVRVTARVRVRDRVIERVIKMTKRFDCFR